MTEQHSFSPDAKKTGRTVDRRISGGLKVYCLNVNSLLNIWMSYELWPHIICLTETKLDNDVRDKELATDGFHKIIRKDRTRSGGGVAMYIKENLNFKVRHDLILDIESISIQLDINYVKPIIISTLYRWPDSLVELFEPIESLFSAIDQENKGYIVSGDLNCDLLKPDQNNQKHIKRIYKTYGFKQFIDKPTRTTIESKTLIDHISSNRPECVSRSGVIPCCISDHDTVFLIRSMRIPKLKKEPKIMTVRKCKNFADLSKIQFDEIKNITDDPNEMWTIWKTWFLDVLNRHAPISDITIKGNNLPYITMEVRQMIRQRDYLRKKANKTGSNILQQAFQQIRNKMTYTVRKLRTEYYSKTLKKNEGDLKKTWKIFMQAMCKDNKTTKIDHININDTIINDKQKISEALNDHFVSIGEKLANEIQLSKNTPEYYLFKTKRNGTNFKF